MLFPYKYVPHQMEKMQEFIDFIFHEVWCKASGDGPFSLDLFDRNIDLKEVMEAFYYSDAKGADFFYGHVERIYGHFAALTTAQVEQFKQWYQANNDIENVCANNPSLQSARYTDVALINAALSTELATFFKGLYSQQLLNLSMLRQKIGDIDDHYQNFMQANCVGKCPFCGMADMHGIYHSKREAYDHYLPKSLYPFNSINFKNLVPACHHCNSTYKSSQDPAYTPKDPTHAVTRRKVFYPYANHSFYHIDIQIGLKKADVEHLTPNDIEIEFGPAVLSEEIETWKDVYGIEERYKAKCCSGDAKDWLEQVRILKRVHDIEPTEFLKTLTEQTNNAPFANANYFKKAFLEGCDRIGLLSSIAEAD